MLPIAPATYYDHLAKRADPARLSDRAKRNEALEKENAKLKRLPATAMPDQAALKDLLSRKW